jgi:hypothetical protein
MHITSKLVFESLRVNGHASKGVANGYPRSFEMPSSCEPSLVIISGPKTIIDKMLRQFFYKFEPHEPQNDRGRRAALRVG